MPATSEPMTGPIIDTTSFAVGELRPFHKNPRRARLVINRFRKPVA